MTSARNKLITLISTADDDTLQILSEILTQANTFGDEWYADMEIHLKNNDRVGMMKTIERYKERL